MKTFNTFAGVDISKLNIDVSIIHLADPNKTLHLKAPNTSTGFTQLICLLQQKGIRIKSTLFICENTGIYTTPFITAMTRKVLHYWVVPAIEIKRSQGIARGKNDKADSRVIALYGLTHQNKYVPQSQPQKQLQQLKLLFTEREKVLKAIGLFERTQENEFYLSKDVFRVVQKINKQQVTYLNKALLKIDKQMLAIVNRDTILNSQYKLLTSITGIGKQTALYLIITTQSFKAFKTWRQMACYAGVAPFEYSSGTSIKGRTKVNHLADKKMKSMLQMCVLSAVKYDPELKQYYQKKKAEGKHVMLVMNNIRCKLLARVFAVINRGTPFVNIQKFAA